MASAGPKTCAGFLMTTTDSSLATQVRVQVIEFIRTPLTLLCMCHRYLGYLALILDRIGTQNLRGYAYVRLGSQVCLVAGAQGNEGQSDSFVSQ